MASLHSALVGTAQGGITIASGLALPPVSGHNVLIKVHAVSVNPVDAKMVGPYVTAGAVAGTDLSGIVEKVGPDVTHVHVGDHVSTAVMGENPLRPDVGAFAEYTTASEDLLLKLPPTFTFEQGASLPTSFFTAGLALFHSLGLPGGPYTLNPSPKPVSVLVYGGSSATGTAAIQLLKLSGYNVIATCSPHNFDLVRKYGAGTVFDYKDPDCTMHIKKHTRNSLKYALDCISTLDSMRFCYQALGRSGGKYTALEPFSEAVAKTRKVVKADWILSLQILGHEIAWPEPHYRPVDPAVVEFGHAWTNTLNRLLAEGRIKLHPLMVRNGGLRTVMESMRDVRSKKISGKKVIVSM